MTDQTGNSSKNIKSAKNNFLSELDIAEAIGVINFFTDNINNAKLIMGSLLLNHNNGTQPLTDETLSLIISWAKDFELLKERTRCLYEGTKPN